jgi:hypothetical protein
MISNLGQPKTAPVCFWSYVVLLLLSFSTSCAEDLPNEWLVVDTRFLGARVEVIDDDSEVKRAWPQPGENGMASLYVVNPSLSFDPNRLETMALTCTKAPFGNGEPLCLEIVKGISDTNTTDGTAPNWVELMGSKTRIDCSMLEALTEQVPDLFASTPIKLACSQGKPTIPFSIEDKIETDETGAELSKKLILGVTCDRGTAYLDLTDPSLFGCELQKGGRKELWALTIPLQTSRESNHHPVLTGVSFNGKPWAPSDEEIITNLKDDNRDGNSYACADIEPSESLPKVGSDRSEVSIGFESESFESYTKDGKDESEQLWIAHLTTKGKFSRAKSVLSKENRRVDVDWSPPTEVPEGGSVVRFFFTIRDHRGGFDSTERAVCVTKGKSAKR